MGHVDAVIPSELGDGIDGPTTGEDRNGGQAKHGDQWVLPPSLDDFVPRGHVAHFIRETVRSDLDLSAILSAYQEERGFPPYHPGMMTALLLYGYSRGVYSSRKLAQACEERLDFMAVTAMNKPDFRTIAAFRRRHLEALAGLFLQALKLGVQLLLCRLDQQLLVNAA